ncbi:MAG: DUF2088 domain-containing protein, partial [Candidatus Latescibacteria bacterium]|nr:DUF2088 domain-containing protein [Candidatus Latescibacterota bacterium]
MKHVGIVTSSWYRDEEVLLEFPDAWEIDVVGLPKRPVLKDEEIRAAFQNPIGIPPISKIVRGKRSAAILVDDLSRPTPAHTLLPYVLKELEAGGIGRDRLLIIIAFGCHRQLSRWELEKKLGPGIVGQIETICHDAQGDLVDLGVSSRGTPIAVNRFALECDVRIGIGGVYPHGGPAWGGGAKIVVPGIVGLETTRHYHSLAPGGHAGDLTNEERLDMEEIAGKIGLDAIINVVLDERRRITGVTVGHSIDAHRQAVAIARDAYTVPPPEDADVVIANAYPMDVSLNYVGKGYWPLEWARPDAIRVLIGTSPDGTGYHSLYRIGRCAQETPTRL